MGDLRRLVDMTSPPSVSFRAFDLPLAVHCDRRIVNKLLELLEEFLSSGGGCYKMHLRYKPEVDQASGEVEVSPEGKCVGGITLRKWEDNRVDIDMGFLDMVGVSAAVGYLLLKALSESGGLLLHASMLVRDGSAYLFSGPSGAGKSTLARNARGMQYVHDDKAAVRRQDGRWWAHGVPMIDNTIGIGRNISAPVRGIYLIEQGRGLSKKPLEPREALGELAEQLIVPVEDMLTRTKVYESLLTLITEVPSFRLRFKKNSDVSTFI